MSYTVTIKYTGIETDASRIVAPICRIFVPTSSYIDTPVYTQGGPLGTGEAKEYPKSIYATNVDGWGNIDVVAPYASTSIPFPVPMAQFNLAVVGRNNEVTFEVADYKEAFYYMQVGAALADQGFSVTVFQDGKQVYPAIDYVTGIAVVDGTDGVTPVTNPTQGQKLLANIILNDGETTVGGYPVDPKAKYSWIKGDDTPLGSEPYFTVTSDLAGQKISCTVSYEGAGGTATWTGTVAS